MDRSGTMLCIGRGIGAGMQWFLFLMVDLNWVEGTVGLLSKVKQLEHLKHHKVCLISKTTDIPRLPVVLKPSLEAAVFTKCFELELPGSNEREDIIKAVTADNDVEDDLVKRLSRCTVGLTAGQISSKLRGALLAPVDQANLTSSSIPLRDANSKLELLTSSEESHPLAGYEQIIDRVLRLLTWPYTHAAHYQRLGVKSTSGILLYGPPGCGKTSIAHHISRASGLSLIHVPISSINSQYLGQTEENIRGLFQRAKNLQPCIVFLDDIDALAQSRSEVDGVQQRVITTLLNEMDGIEDSKNVVVLACTNRPWTLDAAIMRPGRLDSHIYIPSPDMSDRTSILKLLCSRSMLDIEHAEIEFIAEATEGYSAADLEWTFREAAKECVRSNLTRISVEVIWKVLESEVKPQLLGSSKLALFEKFENKLAR
jgi:SpoVK/Ycf46/Vps4 family AAA+-type ATPase